MLHVQRIGVHAWAEAEIRAHAVNVETVLAIALPIDGEHHTIGLAPTPRMGTLDNGVRTDALQLRDEVGGVEAFTEEGCTDAVVLHGWLCLHRHRHRGQCKGGGYGKRSECL